MEDRNESLFTLRFSADTIESALLLVAVDLAERLAAESDRELELDDDGTPTDQAVQEVIGERHLLCPASALVDLALALGIQPPPLLRAALR